jgi:hypothetical protein
VSRRKRWILAGTVLGAIAVALYIPKIFNTPIRYCTGTYTNIHFGYECSWHVSFPRADETKMTGALVMPMNRQVMVAIAHPYPTIVPGGDGLVETWEVVDSQAQKNLPDTLDVRIVYEDKTNFSITFTPEELLMSNSSYKSMGLSLRRMVVVNPDSAPPFSANGHELEAISLSKENIFFSLGGATSWFQNPYAQAAHRVLLSVTSTH